MWFCLRLCNKKVINLSQNGRSVILRTIVASWDTRTSMDLLSSELSVYDLTFCTKAMDDSNNQTAD